jgi:quinol-cytochrome oxidoreductase complex cytochrome b subunit
VGVKYEDKKMANNLLVFGIIMSAVNFALFLTILYQFLSLFLVLLVYVGLFALMYYGLPEVPKSTKPTK